MEIKELLERVRKPSRYVGGEFGSVIKKNAEVKVALAHPDLYEIGMSYLGLRILYFLINSFPYASAERVFMPDLDMVMELEKRKIPLFTLETKRPLGEFDLVAFSFLYELNYTNLLWMLKLGEIPILSEERSEGDPLIGAGGPTIINPEPLSRFVDFFYIGDGEPFFSEILPVFRKIKGRRARLEALSGVDGVYIPDPDRRKLHSHGHYFVEGISVKKRIVENLDEYPFPEDAILSHGESVFDRLAWEIARGCPQKCRFCQATQFYSPFRARNISEIASSIIRSLKKTGYEEVSFSSLSTADFPFFHQLLTVLYPEFKRWRISVSLPSLRPHILQQPEIASIIADLRKTSFTIVPEAGTERLRSVINKDVTEDEILRASETAFKLGWRRLKFYFMIGLPGETEEDLKGIGKLLFRVSDLGRNILGRPPRISVSISNFVPMPWTPFQWIGLEDREMLREKQRFVLRHIKKKRNIRVNFHKIEQSFLESFLSRADFRAGDAIERVFKLGGVLEAWSDKFKYDLWEEAFAYTGLDPEIFTGSFPVDAPLPWDHIKPGPFKEYLLLEYKKAMNGERTPSCLQLLCGRCRGCEYWKIAKKRFPQEVTLEEHLPERKEEGRFLYLIEYEKKGIARFLSQTDLLKTMERTFRRAGSPISFSEGFHPKPRISLAPALPVGVEGERELAEIEFTSEIEEGIMEKWNSLSIDGLRYLSLRKLEGRVIPHLKGALYASPDHEREKIESLGFKVEDVREGEVIFIHNFGTPSPARRAREAGYSLKLRRVGLLKG